MGLLSIFDALKRNDRKAPSSEKLPPVEPPPPWKPTEQDLIDLVDQFSVLYTKGSGVKSEVQTFTIRLTKQPVLARGQNLSWKEIRPDGTEKDQSITFAWFLPDSDSSQKATFYALLGDNPAAPDPQTFRVGISREIGNEISLEQLKSAIQRKIDSSRASLPTLLNPWEQPEKSDV